VGKAAACVQIRTGLRARADLHTGDFAANIGGRPVRTGARGRRGPESAAAFPRNSWEMGYLQFCTQRATCSNLQIATASENSGSP